MEKTTHCLIQDLLLNTSPAYIEQQYQLFLNDPKNLDESWLSFFIGRELGKEMSEELIDEELEVRQLIEDFRLHGHRFAKFNLLDRKNEENPLYETLKRIPDGKNFKAARHAGLRTLSSNDLKRYLKDVFTGNVGIEFGHVNDPEVRGWIEKKVHPKNLEFARPEKKIEFHKQLLQASLFEEFLQKSYQGKKRFSLEGCEALICALHAIATSAVDEGLKELNLSMAHRGRLNVLANFLSWPYDKLFAEFEELYQTTPMTAKGDVKYHFGHSNDIKISNKQLHISLAFNPSHLEFVYPVTLGKTLAKIKNRYQGNKNAVLPIVIHGDAAVVGQGIVAETLNLSELKAYSLGGTVHFVINNQLGFTAEADESRSTVYCTDFAKAIEAPIFHVNANDVESVVNITKMAFEFRQKFSRDVFIDINCYRRHGHNETDEPSYTNPLLYQKIKKEPSLSKLYSNYLLKEGIIDEKFEKKFSEDYIGSLEKSLNKVRENKIVLKRQDPTGQWANLMPPPFEQLTKSTESGIKEDHLNNLIKGLHHIPKEFHLISKLERSIKKRLSHIQEKGRINWAFAELLAFGSLLNEEFGVRLLGQDSVRGTFSQRHAAYVDQKTGERYFPLKQFEKNSTLDIHNSPLSENAAMGFEYGYSLSAPNTLTLWEAQYGDFFNAAQVIVDQFIVASENKWGIYSGLVLLLPHGYEGQGPDHSSARIERFLQLSAQGNIQVTVPSTAGQYFHLLRRQMLQKYRKPLIVFTPKSLLRSDLIASEKADFLKGGFKNIISHPSGGSENRGLICSGKIYWELYKEAKRKNILDKIIFVRIEQLYPLDIENLKNIVEENQKIKEWYWVQEEPQNCGGWSYMKLNTLSLDWNLKYIGRPVNASTAEGSQAMHKMNQNLIIEKALNRLEN